MPAPLPPDAALALIHEGWDHLKRQSDPWRPGPAGDGPCRSSRATRRRRTRSTSWPTRATCPTRPGPNIGSWSPSTPPSVPDGTRAFRRLDLGDLGRAAGAYGALAEGPPDDAQARFNEGLCLAWLGRNAEAVEALDLATRGLAEGRPDAAVEAWTLAEVLRQGGGAEPLADDLRHSATFSWTLGDDPAGFLDARADVRPMLRPRLTPVTGLRNSPRARLYGSGSTDRRSGTTHESPLLGPRHGPSGCLARCGCRGPTRALLEATIIEVAAPRRQPRAPRPSAVRPPCPSPSSMRPSGQSGCPPGLDDEGDWPGSTVRRSNSITRALRLHRPRKAARRPVADRGGPGPPRRRATRWPGPGLCRRGPAPRATGAPTATTALLYQGYPFDRLRRRPRPPRRPTPRPSTRPTPALDERRGAGRDRPRRPSDATSPWPTPTNPPPQLRGRSADRSIRRRPGHALILPPCIALDVRALFATLVRREEVAQARN